VLDSNYKFLLSLGFERAGEWLLRAGILQYTFTSLSSANPILYAFVVDGEVAYLGKSCQMLRARMNGYRTPGPTQRTNIENHKRLKEVLSQGKRVEIIAFAPKEEIHYRGVPINLPAGLEDNLIKQLKPPWNKLGNG
jgi:hypothetical protein